MGVGDSSVVVVDDAVVGVDAVVCCGCPFFCQGDHLVRQMAEFLGLGFRRYDALVLDEGTDHVAQHAPLVGRRPVQFAESDSFFHVSIGC